MVEGRSKQVFTTWL